MRSLGIVLSAVSVALVCGCSSGDTSLQTATAFPSERQEVHAGHSATENIRAKDSSVSQPNVRQRHEMLRDRARRKFNRAVFLSPRIDADVGIPLWMAPLVVQEMPDSSQNDLGFHRFGAVKVDEAGRAVVDANQLTVYLAPTHVSIGGRQYEQFNYLWFYSPMPPSRSLRYRGVRMTLGRRGYGVIWEILSSEAEGRMIYVSQPLEKAAAAKLGTPLPGRSFSVEPRLEEHPDVVVPRVVGDGPQPMGPFVYLDAVALNVTTLICRCEPSQAGEFPLSTHYTLRRIEDFAALHAGRPRPANLPQSPQPADLQALLRLPEEL